ncbi:OmpA family protein [Spirosoma aureum]|uniref:OmpA family protein n=1 Tax=Spirosoma aureum TaxID=2692134 RepID=A0A6G9AN07_9BACT|nr:OmpA family protein [Spirosoma aureum]QIP13726.1 OmpA family protein [Spirosoma aureum]
MKTIFICLITFSLSATVNAQIINPKRLFEKKANQAIEKKVDETLNNKSKKEETSKDKELPKEAEKVNPSQAALPSLQTYSRFDFIPGEKVIFFDDFTQDNIGDFPALWNTNGSAEIVTTNLFPGRWMKFASRNAIWTDGLLKLPDNYTLEFDVIPIKSEEGRMAGYNFRLLQSINAKSYDHGSVPGKAGFLFSCEYYGRTGYRTYINDAEGADLGLSGYKDGQQFYQVENYKYHISIWVQKARLRLYQDANKLFDLPKAFPLTDVRFDRIRFENGAAMVSNIRIAVGTPDMRNKLITEGKLVSYGIYFDVNKDVVKPESYGTLKEIASVLNENPTFKIKIVGHTDGDGADAANLDLSKRRAAAVKTEIVRIFSIDSVRIETDGQGESQPVAPNDSPSNKALNRRVEFVKL